MNGGVSDGVVGQSACHLISAGMHAQIGSDAYGIRHTAHGTRHTSIVHLRMSECRTGYDLP